MSHVMVDSSLHERPETFKLRNLLRNSYAELFVIRMWSYGMRVGIEDGILDLDDASLASVTGYPDDPAGFRSALVESGFLVPRDDDQPGHYMRGWSRNHEFFRTKKRRADYMRDYRRRKREEAERAATEKEVTVTCNSYVTDDVPGSPSLSLSPSRREERGEEAPPAEVTVTQEGTMTVKELDVHLLNELALPGIPQKYLPELSRLAATGKLTHQVVGYVSRKTRAAKAGEGKKLNAPYFCSVLLDEMKTEPVADTRAPVRVTRTRGEVVELSAPMRAADRGARLLMRQLGEKGHAS